MGWNEVDLTEDMDLFAGLGTKEHFYFAHSYYADVTDTRARIAFTDYGFELPAAVEKGNIYGAQFPPEKSGPAGLDVLRNFEKICDRKAKLC